MENNLLLVCWVLFGLVAAAYSQGIDYTALDALLRVRNEPGALGAWVETSLGYFRWRLRACSDAHVLLGDHPGNTSHVQYEVVLGYEGSSDQHVMRSTRDNSTLASATAAILSCYEDKHLWVTWTNQSIHVGTGESLGEGELMSATTIYGFTTRSVALGSSAGQTAQWTFHKDIGHVTQVPVESRDSPDYHHFRYTWQYSHDPVLVFKVKMCEDARILMTESENATASAYELRIGTGGNTRCEVHKNGQRYYEQNTPAILDCDQFKYFWWSRRQGIIEFGSGSRVGEQRIFAYTEMVQETRALAFSNAQLSQGGVWELRNLQGNYYTAVTRNDGLAFSELLLVPAATFLEFSLRACSDAVVALSNDSASLGDSWLLVVGEDNARTALYEVNDGLDGGYTLWAVVDTPRLLSCDSSRQFWLSWRDETLSFGTGLEYLNESLLVWSAPLHGRTLGVTALSLTSHHDSSKAAWTFSKQAVRSFSRHTDGLPHWDQLWYAVADQSSLVFTVQACGDALVQLPEFSRVNDYHTYELHLGMMQNGNQMMRLRKVGSEQALEVTMLQQLHCERQTTFWISWVYLDGRLEIRVGDGPFPGQVSNMLFIDEAPYQINYATISSSLNHTATWTFTDITVNMYTVHALAEFGYNNGFTTLPSQWFEFEIKATTDACFVLSANSDWSDTTQYTSVEVCMGTERNQQSRVTDLATAKSKSYDTKNVLSTGNYRRYWLEWAKTQLKVGVGALHISALFTYDLPSGELQARFVHFKAGVGAAYFAWAKDTHGLSRFYTTLTAVPVSQTSGRTPIRVSSKNTARHIAHSSSGDEKAFHSNKIVLSSESASDNYHPDVPLNHARSYSPGALALSPALLDGLSSSQRLIDGLSSSKRLLDDLTSSQRLLDDLTSSQRLLDDLTSSQRLLDDLSSSQRLLDDLTTSQRLLGALGSPEAVWVVSVGAEHVVFGVQSCSEAYLLLSSMYGSDDFLVYQIGLGVEGNNKTSITGLYHGGFTRTLPTASILSCETIREFWVSWANQRVEVGYGRLVGENGIVTYDDLVYRSVHAYTFTSTSGNATWEFPEYESDWYSVTTRASDASPPQVLTRTGYFDFEVQACAKAYIRLHKNDSHYYMVKIGEDSINHIQIYRQGYQQAYFLAPDLLACGEYRRFWLAWTHDAIQLGSDWVEYGNLLAEWRDESLDSWLSDVTQLQLCSNHTKQASWLYPKHTGNATIYTSSGDADDYGLGVAVRNVEEALFRVKTCNQALILLANIPGVYTERTLQLVLETNTVKLLAGIDGIELDSYSARTPLLDCNVYTPYWVTWSDQWLEFGQGMVIGDSRLLQWPLSGAYTLGTNQIAVATNMAPGTWEFAQTQAGHSFHVHTLPLFDLARIHEQLWVSRNYEYIQFAVMASEEARIALSYTPTRTDAQFYEVILGASANKELRIEHTDASGVRRVELAKAQDKLLSGKEYREFWVGWANLQLKVGAGQYDNGLLASPLSLRHYINGISFSTGNSSHGDWLARHDSDDAVRVLSSDEFKYADFSLTLADRQHLVFSVKACKNAEVVLAREFGNEKARTYRIQLGMADNTKCAIHTDVDYQEWEQQDILNCEQYRTFWVSWVEDQVKLGVGGNPGYNVLGSAMAQSTGEVVQAFLDTGDSDMGLWQLIDIEGNSYTFFSPDSHGYDLFWFRPATHFFQFQVRACRDAHVGLLAGVDYSSAEVRYEIVIGSGENQKCQIRNASLSGKVANATTPNILDCQHFRTFWVGWEGGVIQLGVGAVNTHLLVEYRDSTVYGIDWLSLSTWSGAQGEFKFLQMQEQEMYVRSRDTGAHNQFWRTVMGYSYIIFRAQARSDMYILLCSVPLQEQTLAYEIRVGIEANTKTSIRKSGGTTHYVNSTDILIEGAFREFWISWTGGAVRFGKGQVIGKQEVISLADSEYQVNALSLSSMMGVEAVWEFPHNQFVQTTTPGLTETATSTASTTTTTTSSATYSTTSSTTTTTSSSSTTTSSTTSPADATIGEPGPPSSDGLSAGAIVGIVFGTLILLLAVTLIVFLAWRRRKNLRYEEFMENAGISWTNPNYYEANQLPLHQLAKVGSPQAPAGSDTQGQHRSQDSHTAAGSYGLDDDLYSTVPSQDGYGC